MNFQPGINITHMVQPESGGVIAYHCSKCKTTVILRDQYGKKPEDGDLFLAEMCADDFRHNFADGFAVGGMVRDTKATFVGERLTSCYFPWAHHA